MWGPSLVKLAVCSQRFVNYLETYLTATFFRLANLI